MAFKICAVGCGAMATRGHGPSFKKYAREHPDTVLAACCDLDPEKGEKYREAFGFQRYYRDLDTMLLAEKPDAVSLVVPVNLTEQLSIHVMEMGIPVILEKPPGMNREQTLRMMEAAERTGVFNQVSFNRRFMPIVREFRQWRQQISGRFWQYDFFRVNRRDGDFSTTSIHGIDTLKFLAGSDYRSVRFRYQPDPGNPELVPVITLDCDFEDGQRGIITFAPATGFLTERCTAHGTNELIHATMPYHGISGAMSGDGELTVLRKGEVLHRNIYGETEGFFVENGFYGENANFFDCVRAGIRPKDDIASGLQSVEIAQCIRAGAEYYEK